MSKTLVTGILGIAILLAGAGCMQERSETPTKGRVHVVVDESVVPLFKAEQAKFEELYPDARIMMDTAQSREAIVRLFNIDSTKLIVTARSLNDEERAVAKQNNITLQEIKVAINAIAVIVNPENTISQLRTTQLDSVLRGLVTNWGDLKAGRSPIAVCLPDQNSGAFEVVAVKVLHGQKYGSPAGMARTSADMVHYVSTHTNALGFVAINWLHPAADSVKILELCDPNAPDSLGPKGEYYRPHQAYVYQKLYPLTADVYMYSKSDPYSPAAGFIAFVASAPGQKIVLNNGLVPATMPVRLVQFKRKESEQ